MSRKKTVRSIKESRAGVTLIEFAMIFPILITILLTTLVFYNYVRIYSAVRHAAEIGASLASSGEVKSETTGINYLNWSAPSGSNPIRPIVSVLPDTCRALTDPTARSVCTQTAITENRTTAVMWPGYTPGGGNPDFGTLRHLPFSLYERSPTAGYNPVQTLPIVGIERGCFEPYNETGSKIIVSAAGRGTNFSNAAACQHVKPMYWQNPVRVDFDGDKREDIVLFRPRGSSTQWGSKGGPAETDFIVLQSSRGYSLHSGNTFFNLATDDDPAPIPVVADYDRDGLADFAVFEPRTGQYRIAFSSVHYQVVGEAYMGISDPINELGLVAIPGNFETRTEMCLSVVQTAAVTASARYDTYLARVSAGVSVSSLEASLTAGQTYISLSASGFKYSTTYKQKPHPGTVSVPAFADYDDDGVTEMGYLSWYGGNWTKHIIGRVQSLLQQDAAGNPYSVPMFETSDLPSISSGGAPVGPLNVRINPFDMAFDYNGDLFVSDSVDHRIWKIARDASPNNDFSGSLVGSIMPSHSTLAQRGSLGTFNAENDFPRENVLNVPTTDTRNVNYSCTTAGGCNLRYPRKIAIATAYDNAMYIADWGNGRIIKVRPASPTTSISTGTTTSVLFGATCGSASPPAQCRNLKDTASATQDNWRNGRYFINPTAVAIVPVNSSRYHLAFSTENAVYLFWNSLTSGGPTGRRQDRIYKIAGIRTPSATNPPTFASGAAATSKYVSLLPRTPPPTPAAQSTVICPVTDLQWDTSRNALIAASSCSLQIKPGTAPVLTKNSGGIFAIESPTRTGTANIFLEVNRLYALAGSYLALPCKTVGNCSEPAITPSAQGVYQRKINLNTNPLYTDIMNPVDIALGTTTLGLKPIYFVDQWNSARDPVDTQRYPRSPHMTDHQHRQGVYVLEPVSNTLQAVGSPLAFGNQVIPVEGVDWPSPHTEGATTEYYVQNHKAPAATIPFPAQAGLVFTPNNQFLLTATPYLANPTSYAGSHPLLTTPQKLGFIYSMSLDLDGDSIPDGTDADIDGDFMANSGDSTGNRSPLCPEIFGTAAIACRSQEKLNMPRQYFFKLGGAPLTLGAESGGPVLPTYGEYDLFNSVSECGPSCSNGDKARSEVWATLFNYGDDQDFFGANSVCSMRAANTKSAYYDCPTTANGPIAAPQPLHSFVGDDMSRVAGTFYPSNKSYLGGLFLRSAYGASNPDKLPDSNLVLFPTVLSSTQPRENGIKTTRRTPIDQIKAPGVRKSGVIGWDYNPERYGASTTEPPLGCPFRMDTAGSSLAQYMYTGFELGWDVRSDNDLMNYMSRCAPSTLPQFPTPDYRVPAVESIVLQLDHDDTSFKENPSSCLSTASMTGSAHWPCQWLSGKPSAPENKRQFFLLDHDGDGVPNPTWLGLETFLDSEFALPTQVRDFNTHGPLMLVSGGIKRGQVANDPDMLTYIDRARGASLFFDTLNLAGPPTLAQQLAQRGFFAYDETLPHGAPKMNSIFDYGKHIYDASRKRSHESALFLSLDYESKVSRTFKVNDMTGPEAAGASMYANYMESNRFRKTAGSQEPPGIAAAQNLLLLAIQGVRFVPTKAEIVPGKGHVSFLNEDGSVCTTYSGSGHNTCHSILVAYGSTLLGQSIIIESKMPIDQGKFGSRKEVCDPTKGPC